MAFNYFIARLTTAWFWFTLLGVTYIGLGRVLPQVYYESPNSLFLNQLFVIVMLIQVGVNWMYVRKIDTSYKPPKGHRRYYADYQNQITYSYYPQYHDNKLQNNGGCVTTTTSSTNIISSSSSSIVINNGIKSPLYMISEQQQQQYRCVNGKEEKFLVYPYWAWKPCAICNWQRPPRTHHCPLCKLCIIKRSHHCFVANCCIGLENQRYFIVFTFWTTIGCLYCLLHSYFYLEKIITPLYGWSEIFLPITFYKWLISQRNDFTNVILVCLLYSVVWFLFFSACSCWEQWQCAMENRTPFEVDNNIPNNNSSSTSSSNGGAISTSTISRNTTYNRRPTVTANDGMSAVTTVYNLRGVFGRKWWINFFIPVKQRLFLEDDDFYTSNYKYMTA